MKKTSELIWQDKQHQVLFELIDEINSHDADTTVFRRLCEYAENHFSLEEEYMAQLNFPGIEAHIREHNKFRAELDSMMNEIYDYDESFREALSVFLTNWLKGHIFGIDKELEKFILESSSK